MNGFKVKKTYYGIAGAIAVCLCLAAAVLLWPRELPEERTDGGKGYMMGLEKIRAYSVTRYEDVEMLIYREENWGDSYFYRAGFALNGITYALTICSVGLEELYAYIDIVLNETSGDGILSGADLTNILGFDVCHIEIEQNPGFQYVWHYYVEMDGKEVCVAEQFGYDGPEIWSRDLDGDGVPELICNVTFGDGVESVVVYRNNNGVIEIGSTRSSYCSEKYGLTDIDEVRLPIFFMERYDPERGVFMVTDYYDNGTDTTMTPKTAEFDDGLEPFEFFPFEHLS